VPRTALPATAAMFEAGRVARPYVSPTRPATRPWVTSTPCPTAVARNIWGAAVELSSWQTYEDAAHGFSVRFPPGWKVTEDKGMDGSAYARFTPPGAEEWAWTAAFVPARQDGAAGTNDARSAGLGHQFLDRKVTRQATLVGGLPAEILTAWTCLVEGWYGQEVSVRRPAGTVYFSNDARHDRAFDDFYNSARFQGGADR